MTKIPIPPTTFCRIAKLGVDRLCHILQNHQYRPPRPDLGIDDHVTGILGEFAVATHLNLPFTPSLDKPDRSDVAGYHVRSSMHPNPHLIIKSSDHPGIYILTRITPESATLLGWCHSDLSNHLAIQPPNDLTGQRWIPHRSLNPITSLPPAA